MRPYSFLSMLVLAGLCLFSSCKKDNADANAPVLNLSTDYITDKSGRTIDLTVNMTIPDGLKSLVITKGINLEPDNVFGSKTVTPVSMGGNNYKYDFSYVLSPDETDKLVGFNFALADNAGRSVQKDLTVITVLSPYQIIFSKKWILKSKFWQGMGEDIKPCEADDVYEWRRDSTMSINYSASACQFDGFNVYDKWTLSEDEKTFTQVYHALFDPSNITVEKYTVRSISSSRLVMEAVFDLTWLGFTDKEVFVYTFEPAL